MDWGVLVAVGGFGVTAASIVYAAGKMNGKMDTHSTQMNIRMDKQDKKLDETVTTLTDFRIEVAADIGKIRGELKLNGNG